MISPARRSAEGECDLIVAGGLDRDGSRWIAPAVSVNLGANPNNGDQ